MITVVIPRLFRLFCPECILSHRPFARKPQRAILGDRPLATSQSCDEFASLEIDGEVEPLRTALRQIRHHHLIVLAPSGKNRKRRDHGNRHRLDSAVHDLTSHKRLFNMLNSKFSKFCIHLGWLHSDCIDKAIRNPR